MKYIAKYSVSLYRTIGKNSVISSTTMLRIWRCGVPARKIPLFTSGFDEYTYINSLGFNE